MLPPASPYHFAGYCTVTFPCMRFFSFLRLCPFFIHFTDTCAFFSFSVGNGPVLRLVFDSPPPLSLLHVRLSVVRLPASLCSGAPWPLNFVPSFTKPFPFVFEIMTLIFFLCTSPYTAFVSVFHPFGILFSQTILFSFYKILKAGHSPNCPPNGYRFFLFMLPWDFPPGLPLPLPPPLSGLTPLP